MNKKVKRLIMIMLSLCIVCILCVWGYREYKVWSIDRINMKYSQVLTSKKEKVKSQFEFYYNRTGRLELYEYCDTPSLTATIINCYFTNSLDKKTKENIEKDLDVTKSEDIFLYTYDLYYYCMLLDKKDIEPPPELVNAIYNCEKKLIAQNNNDVSLLTCAWKLHNACMKLKIELQGNVLASMLEKEIDYNDDKESELTGRIIKACYEDDKEEIKEIFDKLTLEYIDEKIDKDLFVIYIGLLPDSYYDILDAAVMDKLFIECVNDYYYISSYVRFICFDMAKKKQIDVDGRVDELFQNMPKNKDGYVSDVAYLIYTRKRLFHCFEISKVLGIDSMGDTVKLLAFNVDKNIASPEEYYYWTQFARLDKDIIVDKDGLTNMVNKASTIKISENNYYSLYYLVKAALMNKVECSELMDNMLSYENDKDYLMINILKEELLFLNGTSKKKLRDFEKEILEYDDESAIDVYYHYTVYLKATGMKPSQEVKKKITETVEKCYIETDHGAGYYRNAEFKYIDISLTYEALFILNQIGL